MDMRTLITIVENQLPMDKASRMARAQEMGFTKHAYHGTTEKFNEFDFERGSPSIVSGFAPHFTDERAEAKGYADSRSEEHGKKGKLLSVFLRVRKPFMGGDHQRSLELSREEYLMISGGTEYPKEHHRTFRDAMNEMGSRMAAGMDRWPHRELWSAVYHKLRAAGYDAIIWDNVPADFHNGKYTKITMLDMSGIRLSTAAFDPARAEENDLRA